MMVSTADKGTRSRGKKRGKTQASPGGQGSGHARSAALPPIVCKSSRSVKSESEGR
jgi:hypothetical protein